MSERKQTRTRARRYVAFLRGINVGGHKKVAMADLRACVSALGFENVTTLLNSGNVVFESTATDQPAITRKIEAAIEATFGFGVGVILRSVDDIQKMVDATPFKDVRVAADTRLYVTFLKEEPKSALKIPYESPDKTLRILRVADGAVFSVVTLTATSGSVDSMSILEKEFGKSITTRNWNTVVKLAAL